MSVTGVITVPNTSGVAPLLVFCYAGASTSGATARPFHDCEFITDWGDPKGTTWANANISGLDKNSSHGPMAAHVYLTAGSFTIAQTIGDSTGAYDIPTQGITVSDPDTYYSGTNTVCISTSGNFSGAPAGSNNVTSSASLQSLVSTHMGTNKRVLFCGGETWTGSAAATFGAITGWTIGSYGTGRATFNVPSGLACLSITSSSCADGRIMDITFAGGGSSAAAVDSFNIQPQRILVLRCFGTGMQRGVSYDGGKWGVVECDFTALSGTNNIACYVNYNGGVTNTDYAAIMGNRLQCGVSNAIETLRSPYWTRTVISFNDISICGSVYAPVKLHNPSTAGVWRGAYSQQNVMSFNTIAGPSGDLLVEIKPQNSSSDERIKDVIFECNTLFEANNIDNAIVISGIDLTFRNNIHKTSNATVGEYRINKIGIEGDGAPSETIPIRVAVLNASGYASQSFSYFLVVNGPNATNTTVKSCLAYAPNASSPSVLSDSGSGTTTGGNSTNTQVKNTNPWSGIPSTAADFQIPTGSYAKNAGAADGVLNSLFSIPRPQGTSIDIGATEFDEGYLPPWDNPSPPTTTYFLRPASVM